MKKILLFGILFSLMLFSHTFAAPVFTATATGTTINASLTGVQGSSDKFRLIYQTTPLPTTAPNNAILPGDISVQTPNSAGIVNWTITNQLLGTTYNIAAEDIPTSSVVLPSYIGNPTTVTTAAFNPTYDPLYTIQDNGAIAIVGKIDPDKEPNYQSYKIYLLLSTSASMTNLLPQSNQQSYQDIAANSPVGIANGDGAADAGAYYWVLSGLAPNTTYYAQQKIVYNGATVLSTPIAFNGGTGSVISTTPSNPTDIISGTNTNLNNSDYTLLAPFPGLTDIPSANTCAQREAAATAAGTAQPVCDINGLLNYAMKLLIGLSGVVLVLRLMYEGYSYMVTDVPFLKASSKAGFFSALLGLLLALTSFIILNTINPKLVNESVNVSQLNIGVAGGDTNAPTIFVPTGQMPKNIFCPGSGRSSNVSAIANSYVGHVTYSQTNKTATAGPDGNAVLDCSGFANTVLQCAGYVSGKDFINGGSASIFGGGNAEPVNMANGFSVNGSTVTINNKVLNPGDLVGWTPSQGGGNGHVIIYIGNGTFADSHAGTPAGGAIGIYPASKIQSLYGGSRANDTIQEVKRTPL